jgi:hypothetical protein
MSGKYKYSNVIGGGYFNSMSGDSKCYSIIGGGRCNQICGNRVNNYLTISGGYCNTLSGFYFDNLTIGGGKWNIINKINNCSDIWGGSTISGGYANVNYFPQSTIVGGTINMIASDCRCNNYQSTISAYYVCNGGMSICNDLTPYFQIGDCVNIYTSNNNCTFRTQVTCSTYSGTYTCLCFNQNIGGDFSGGLIQNISAKCSCNFTKNHFIGGGFGNTIYLNSEINNSSSIVGGALNTISCAYSFIGGGLCNATYSQYTTISGGHINTAIGSNSTIGGGYGNTSCGSVSTIGGGRFNTTQCEYNTISGGLNNTISQANSTISGGVDNVASNFFSFVGSGRSNTASGDYSAILSGYGNITSGSFSGAFGCEVTNSCACSFMSNQLRACNIFSAGSICANAGGTIVPVTSDCRLKANISCYELGLNELSCLQPKTYTWNEKSGNNTCHKQVGFIAQEVKQVVPESVFMTQSGYYGFDALKLIPLLTNSIKQLSCEVACLKQMIK